MKRKTIIALVMAVLIAGAVDAFAASAGKLTRASGKVTVHRGASALTGRPGMPLNVGDIVQTDAASYAKLLMSDGTLLNVGPKSRMRVRNYNHDPRTGQRTANYDLVYGRGRARIPKGTKPPNVRFSTPTAVAGVRGTEIIFVFDPVTNTTQIVVVGGTLLVVNPDQPGTETTLTDGMSTTIGAGTTPTTPVPMSPGDILNLQNEIQGGPLSPNDAVPGELPGQNWRDMNNAAPPPSGEGGAGRKIIEGVVITPQDLIDQEPAPFTPVIINIYLR